MAEFPSGFAYRLVLSDTSGGGTIGCSFGRDIGGSVGIVIDVEGDGDGLVFRLAARRASISAR